MVLKKRVEHHSSARDKNSIFPKKFQGNRKPSKLHVLGVFYFANFSGVVWELMGVYECAAYMQQKYLVTKNKPRRHSSLRGGFSNVVLLRTNILAIFISDMSSSISIILSVWKIIKLWSESMFFLTYTHIEPITWYRFVSDSKRIVQPRSLFVNIIS